MTRLAITDPAPASKLTDGLLVRGRREGAAPADILLVDQKRPALIPSVRGVLNRADIINAVKEGVDC